MCIRDSYTANSFSRNGKFQNAIFNNSLGESDRVHQNGVGAVSYTHLRAHETVLDLVCRLLLEKKNCVRSLDTFVIMHGTSDTVLDVSIPHPQQSTTQYGAALAL